MLNILFLYPGAQLCCSPPHTPEKKKKKGREKERQKGRQTDRQKGREKRKKEKKERNEGNPFSTIWYICSVWCLEIFSNKYSSNMVLAASYGGGPNTWETEAQESHIWKQPGIQNKS